MKFRKSTPRTLFYLSAIALSMAGCSQNTTKVKPSIPPTASNQNDPLPTSGGQSRLFHYSKKGVRQVKIADTRKSKRVQYEYANLWERLFDSYALPAVRNDSVERELAWFVNHPTYLQRAQQRAEPFLYNIVQQVERQGVPGELALLPVVESAFQAQAVSPAKAAGIWQFIPTTGRHYGLRQNHSYDGRRDVYASTKAAIKYLKKLNRQFNGDWLLSIAAYNCGEGAVERAIRRNESRGLPTDFWSLDLPQETRAYVPRLLAVSRVFSDADRFGVDLRYIPNEAVFKPVKVSQQLDLALAADAADMSLDEFRALNPGFKNMFADPEGSVRLFVPADKSKTFKKELARLASAQTDLMRREFERSRPAGDDYGSYGSAPSTPDSYQSTTANSIESAVVVPVATRAVSRPLPAPSPETSVEPTPVSSAPATPAEYTDLSAADNPFQPSSSRSYEEPSNEPAAEQPAHHRAKRTSSRHATTRPHTEKATSKHQGTRSDAGGKHESSRGSSARSSDTHKPAVAYRYSASSDHKGAAKGRGTTSSSTATSRTESASATHKAASRITVASAAQFTPKVGQPMKYKSGKDGAASSGANSTKSAKSGESARKGEHVASAKADPPHSKSKR